MLDRWLDAPRQSNYGPWTVKRPITIMEDGHASRFHLLLMLFRREKQMHSYIELSGTSGCFQLLDQFFKKCHDEYNNGVSTIREIRGVGYQFGKWDAMNILASMWPKCGPIWVSPWTVLKSWARVGVTPDGVSFISMDLHRLHDDSDLTQADCSPRRRTGQDRRPHAHRPQRNHQQSAHDQLV